MKIIIIQVIKAQQLTQLTMPAIFITADIILGVDFLTDFEADILITQRIIKFPKYSLDFKHL